MSKSKLMLLARKRFNRDNQRIHKFWIPSIFREPLLCVTGTCPLGHRYTWSYDESINPLRVGDRVDFIIDMRVEQKAVITEIVDGTLIIDGKKVCSASNNKTFRWREA